MVDTGERSSAAGRLRCVWEAVVAVRFGTAGVAPCRLGCPLDRVVDDDPLCGAAEKN